MEDNVLVNELKRALNLIMSPIANKNMRNEAQKFVENFKETSANCSRVGIQLAHKNNDQVSRHFGLQLLEYGIKFRWNNMDMKEKQFIKNNTLALMQHGTLSILEEPMHIKDALSKVLVEIAKREWPQQWMQMISEFNELSSLGPIQEELVLLVLLRLAEDVFTFHALPPARRKDLSKAFTSIISELLTFFTNTLNKYSRLYIELKDGDTDESRRTCDIAVKLMCRSIEASTSFLEVMSMHLLLPTLVPLLINCLSSLPVQLSAIDCLLEIAARKGKTEEKEALVNHFLSNNSLQQLQAVAVSSAERLGTEEGFLFFKKLCQLLVTIGTQLCSLLMSLPVKPYQDSLLTFVNIILSFTTHPSQVVSGLCMPLWSALMRCEALMGGESSFKCCCCPLMHASVDLLVKVGQPSQNTNPSSAYSKFDFDTDEDFLLYFSKYRVELGEVLRMCAGRCPREAYVFAHAQVCQLLALTTEAAATTTAGSSLMHLKWEAVVLVFEFLVGRIDFMNIDEDIVQSALAFYKQVLDFQTTDPPVCSNLLSIISVLFPLLATDHSLLSPVINKLFQYIDFSTEAGAGSRGSRSKDVLNIRRHACSVLIKISKLYPLKLLPAFDQLHSQIKAMAEAPEGLSQLEKATCYEALILIHNSLNDYHKQAAFLHEILQSVKVYWVSEELTRTLSSVDFFMHHTGLTSSAVEAMHEDPCLTNRSKIQFCLTMILAVVKRSTCLVASSDGQPATAVSPASQVVPPLLHNTFAILKCYHEMFLPHNFSKLHPSLHAIFALSEADKAQLIGVSSKESTKTLEGGRTAVERMTTFFNNLYEMAYSILGQCCKYLSESFFSLPDLPYLVLNHAFCNVFVLPHLKIKQNLHCFYKQFLKHCPSDKHLCVLLPVVTAISPCFYQFLSTKWQKVSSRYMSRINSEEAGDNGEDRDSEYQETQELIEDQLLIVLTKEYLECIDNLLRDKRQPCVPTMDAAMDDSQLSSINASKRKVELVGEFAQLLITHDDAYYSVAWLLFLALSWPDTSICLKALEWCFPVLKHLMSEGKVTTTTAQDLFHSQLVGLNIHGQHDAIRYLLINSLLSSYELLAPKFPNITSLMLTVPGCTEENLMAFNNKLSSNSGAVKNFEKKKREHFKNLLEGAIGQNIGQKHSKQVHIKKLTPFKLPRQKQEDLWSQNQNFSLCSLFTPEPKQ